MAIFKCKMCGGALEIGENQSVATCEYCGTKQTLPKLDNEQKVNLYDRANHFRRNNDYDKAMAIYENILNTDTTDAEAYWSILLCRFGVEYVEDPSTHKQVPTINRAQFTSVFADEDYKSAIEYASPEQKEIYKQEAAYIDEVQKGILEISNKEEPFDVFICYKETDSNGRRTRDSVLATELYHGLVNEGFKVFFSRITLEDKLGQEYEPYIFAALNSAKVMVVIGTRPEHFNAVWVKNEWSRYLSLVKKSNGQKILIPAYKDMDPYDLPEEFSHLQAQDMSKLGFMQDLIRGIKKIVVVQETVKETVVVNNESNVNTGALLKRVFLFLEDGEWARADEFCEQVLNIDPECAEAYLGKLMSEYRVKKQEELKDLPRPFDNSNNYQRIIRFADDNLKNTVKGYVEFIKNRIEQQRLESIYTSALNTMNSSNDPEVLFKTAEKFESIKEFKNSAKLKKECHEKAEIAKKDGFLNNAKTIMDENDVPSYESAIKILKCIPGWKDSDELVSVCEEKIAEIKAKEEADRLERERYEEVARKQAAVRAKRKKVIVASVSLCLVLIIAFVAIWEAVIIPYAKYNDAVELMEKGDIVAAYEALSALDGYKDSAEKAESIFEEYTKEKLCSANEGEYIFFGEYEQDNDMSNGKEDIEWLVLDKQEDKIFIISKYVLDCKEYNTTETETTWRTSSIRQWLNNEFLNEAFIEDELNMISTTVVSADKNSNYSTFQGINTEDKVFLVSQKEANNYFDSDESMQCDPTQYAIQKGVHNNEGLGCQWWLRTLGIVQHRAMCTFTDGEMNFTGIPVADLNIGIRPAMWISIDDVNSVDIKSETESKENTEDLNVGDIYTFGTYEQDNNTVNGKEDIEWLVLDKQEDKIFVISKYALDCQPFNDVNTKVTWETCTLRKWLNDDFYESAFSEDEKLRIPTVLVTASEEGSSMDFGNDTKDKIFLLNITEANKYFDSDSNRLCKPTDYAEKQGVFVGSSKGAYWWLRTATYQLSTNAAHVDGNGDVFASEHSVNNDVNGVRPAMWISIE